MRKPDAGGFLSYDSLKDLGSSVEYAVREPSGRRRVIRAPKSFKLNNRDLSGLERQRFIRRDFDLSKARPLVFQLERGHIGDTVIAFEAVLGLRELLREQGRPGFKLLAAMGAEKRRFFDRFLKLVPVFDGYAMPGAKPGRAALAMPTLHPDLLADHLSMGSHWDFYWAQWGLPGRFRPADALTARLLRPFRAQARRQGAELRAALGFGAKAGYVAFFPESAPVDGTHKLWPISRWVELVLRVLQETELSVLVCTHRRELRELAKREPRVRVFDPARAPVRADFLTMATLIEGSRAVVSLDSGAAHVAGFVGKPCITLFGPTNPGLEGHRANLNLRISSCPPCGWRHASRFCVDNVCMKEILTEDVLGLLKGALEGRFEPR